MSDMVGSAIVGEAVSRVFSGVISKYAEKPHGRGSSERLEMAHIKMEAAVELSSKWQITDVSLLRWRRKLKRASQECSDMMRECKRRSQEDRRFQEKIKQSSFPRRFGHATKSFISSVVGQKDDEFPSKATVRRFERLADGADNFLRYIQLGGTPRQCMFSDPLIKHLFAGKYLEYQMWHRSQYHSFGILPVSFEGCGLQAKVWFSYGDYELPENNFQFGCMLRLSESTDIIGIIVKCLQLVTSHFKSTAEFVMRELIQLPTQDFCWMPFTAYVNVGHWNHVQITLSQFFRPDPFCCQGYDLPITPTVCTSRGTNPSRISATFPEPVGHVYLKGHIALSDYNSLQRPITGHILELGVLFAPHDEFNSAVGVDSSCTETIDGEKQEGAPFDAHPDELDEMLLPRAIDYLSRNAAATMYRISRKSRHGSTHLYLEKLKTQKIVAGKDSKVLEWRDLLNKGHCKEVASDYLKMWGLSSSSLGCQ